MANNINIPEELDALIQEYLTDGVLTSKEREVILEEAEKMKLNIKKIDLYLDAQVQKIDQANDAATRRRKGKACPYCGAPVPLLADKCPECRQYLTPEASDELQDILDHLENALVDLKSGNNIERSKATVERYARKAKMYYSNNPKIKPLLDEVGIEMSEAEKKAKSSQRKNAFLSFLKNKWIWFALPILFGIVFILCGLNKFESAGNLNKNSYVDYFEFKAARDHMETSGGWMVFFGLALAAGGAVLIFKNIKK